MGLFDRFKKQEKLPEDLLTQLLNSNSKDLPDLCKKHWSEIKSQFSVWSVVPVEYRNNAEKRNWYANGLINLAVCMNELGDSDCLEHLQGGNSDNHNPLDRIGELCEQANNLSDRGSHDEAIKLLNEILTTLSGLKGPGVDFYQPRVLGLIGMCHFRTGNKKGAELFTQQAYDFCISIRDEEGANIYGENLRILQSQ